MSQASPSDGQIRAAGQATTTLRETGHAIYFCTTTLPETGHHIHFCTTTLPDTGRLIHFCTTTLPATPTSAGKRRSARMDGYSGSAGP